MASELVEEAVARAQDAVIADTAGDYEKAIELYSRSVELIKRALQLQLQRAASNEDTEALQRYEELYSNRITRLQEHLQGGRSPKEDKSAWNTQTDGSGAFSLGDADVISQAVPPGAAPQEEWRRGFWLMRILRSSMVHGGFLSPDAKVFVPRRLWLQRGAKFTAMPAKHECAECLVNELRRACAVDYKQPRLVLRELERLVEIMDGQQNSLSRLLPFVPETAESGKKSDNAMVKMTERFRGLAKTLDKTAARLGSLPTKCADPHEYVQTLVDLFDAAAFVEKWTDHYAASLAVEREAITLRLHRTSRFFYEVVCAFVLHDLNGLLQRHVRKASAAFVKLSE